MAELGHYFNVLLSKNEAARSGLVLTYFRNHCKDQYSAEKIYQLELMYLEAVQEQKMKETKNLVGILKTFNDFQD